jgi:predicted DNA-binding protein (MmcQ/YjbR family)
MPEAEPSAHHSALRAYCAAAPGAVERRRLRETLYTARGRVFAFLGSPRHPAVTVRARPDDRAELLRHPAVQRARWVGWLGWITVSVSDKESLELARVLIAVSHELVTSSQPR